MGGSVVVGGTVVGAVVVGAVVVWMGSVGLGSSPPMNITTRIRPTRITLSTMATGAR